MVRTRTFDEFLTFLEQREKRSFMGVGPGPVAAAVPGGNCPGGDSLGKPCDAKRPWPQCPPQSYCFAVNTVDIGPYYCCPVCKKIMLIFLAMTLF